MNLGCDWTTGVRLKDYETEEMPKGVEYLEAFPNPFAYSTASASCSRNLIWFQ